MHRLTILGAVTAILLTAPGLQAQEWGNVKGQIVWGLDELPKPEKLNVDKDQAHCLRNGPLFSEDYVIDKNTKGVKWVVVWLIDATDPMKKLPIHPKLEKVGGPVVVDQPCCVFEPHVIGLREGQSLEVRNSADIPHNVNVIGGTANPNLNVIIPPRGKVNVENWQAARTVVPISCTIHGWMKGYVRVFAHPYFAVTNDKGEFEIKDAPAGKFRLVTWQESVGWVQGGKEGIPIEIKANETTTVPPIKLKPE